MFRIWAILFSVVTAMFASSTAIAKAPEPPECDVAREMVEVTICVPTWVTRNSDHQGNALPQGAARTKGHDVQADASESDARIEMHQVLPRQEDRHPDDQDRQAGRQWVVQEYTVQVPHQEVRKGTRKVCRLKPGTCDEYETVEEPYECVVTVCKPEVRTCRTQVWDTVHEEQVKTHTYCTVEPRVTVTPYEATECRWLPFEKVETYMACVPYEVEKQIEVKVCKMVPKQSKSRAAAHSAAVDELTAYPRRPPHAARPGVADAEPDEHRSRAARAARRGAVSSIRIGMRRRNRIAESLQQDRHPLGRKLHPLAEMV